MKSYQEQWFFGTIDKAKTAIDNQDAFNLWFWCIDLAQQIEKIELFGNETVTFMLLLESAAELGYTQDDKWELALKIIERVYVRGLDMFERIIWHKDFIYNN